MEEWNTVDCLHCQIALAALIVVSYGVLFMSRHEKEKYFLTAAGETEPFPSHSSLKLSVVVPAYNEESRSQ
uniref:Uncharacterized protein n=1 Tax=Oncorhynchus mykiss TaxID=8022 RepID=A0A8K9WPL7_ONCMY